MTDRFWPSAEDARKLIDNAADLLALYAVYGPITQKLLDLAPEATERLRSRSGGWFEIKPMGDYGDDYEELRKEQRDVAGDDLDTKGGYKAQNINDGLVTATIWNDPLPYPSPSLSVEWGRLQEFALNQRIARLAGYKVVDKGDGWWAAYTPDGRQIESMVVRGEDAAWDLMPKFYQETDAALLLVKGLRVRMEMAAPRDLLWQVRLEERYRGISGELPAAICQAWLEWKRS